jgi:hypothetical protein
MAYTNHSKRLDQQEHPFDHFLLEAIIYANKKNKKEIC